LAVKWADALGTAPNQISVKLGFTVGGKAFETVLKRAIPADANAATYTLTAADLSGALQDLFTSLNVGFGQFTDATNPLTAGLDATVTVTPIDLNRAATPVALGTKLSFGFTPMLPTPQPTMLPKMVPADDALPK
jgi:hypothetical protein